MKKSGASKGAKKIDAHNEGNLEGVNISTTRKYLEDDSYRDARELNDRGKTERKSMDEEINEWNKKHRGKKDPLTGMDLV